MKNKSSHHKLENTFRFQPFAERISNIDIDIFHHVPHEYEIDEDDLECNFHQCLEKWNMLCLTQDYQRFQSKLSKVITLPQLLHHKQLIVDLLIEHIQKQEVLSLQAFLDILVAFVRDLQKEFYVYYPKFFDLLISLLITKESDQIEWTFTTLAHLFKLLWRCLIKDIQNIFKTLLPLLSDNQPEYVRNFASESFAFVVRKIKDKKMFLDLILKTVQECDDGVVGCGKLLFEVMNGIDGNMHSCTEIFLTFLLDSLSEQKSSRSLLFEILQEVIQNVCSNVKPQHNAAFWKCFFDSLHKPKSKDCLNETLSLMKIAIKFRSGLFVTIHRPTLVLEIKTILNMKELDEDTLMTISEICVLLLKSKNIHLNQEESVTIATKILGIDSKNVILNFVENAIDYTLFHVHILPHFLKESVKNNLEKDYLKVLYKLCQSKAPFAQNGINLYSWQAYRLPFISTNGSAKCLEVLLENLHQIKEDTCDHAICMQSLICLPHIANKNEKAVDVLKENLQYLCNKIQSSATKNDLLILQCLVESLIHLNFNVDIIETHFENILDGLLPLSTDFKLIESLKILDICFTFMCINGSRFKSIEILTKINQTMFSNFSSPYHEIRLLTTHIYTLFENLPLFNDLKIFTICHAVEATAISVENYRDQLHNLQKLDWNTTQMSVIKNTEFETIPLKYLIGVLYINFKLFWDPVCNLIETYARGMEIPKFWSIFFEELKSATLFKPLTEEIVEETGNILILTKDSEKYEDRPDFLNFRFQMWKALNLFPDLAEMKTRDLTELFLEFYENEFMSNNSEAAVVCNIKINPTNEDEIIGDIDEETEEKSQLEKTITSKKGDSKQKKNSVETLIQCLSIYGKVKSPLSMYKERELYKIYLSLLSYKHIQVQKTALDCLMPYKHKYLVPYKEHLYELIQENNLKNQLTLFRVDAESNVVQNEHRDDLMPLLMRIIHAKMTSKIGMRTGGRNSGQYRRNLVLRFLAGCQEKEMMHFINMSFHYYEKMLQLDENPQILCKKIKDNIQFEQFPAIKRLRSSANLLSVIFQQFGGLMSDKVMKIFVKVLLVIGTHVTAALEQDSNVFHAFFQSLKSLRVICIKVLDKFFNRFDNYNWATEEIDAVFDVFVWPTLGKFSSENVTNPSALLKLFHQWGQNPNYFHLLEKRSEQDKDEYALKHILSLLTNEKSHFSVVNLVVEIVERLLSLRKENECEAEKTDELNYGTKLLIPHVLTVLSYFQRKLCAKKNFSQRDMFILSRISELVQDPETSDKVLSLLLPILLKKYTGNASPETAVDSIITVANLLNIVPEPLKHVQSLSPLFSIITAIPARKLLCKVLDNLGGKDEIFSKISTIILKINAFDKKWVEQPDYLERLDGFKIITSLGDEISSDLGLLIIYNCWYFIQHEKDISLRENSVHCLKTIGPILCRKFHNTKKMDLIINDTLLTLIRNGIKSKNIDVRNESIAILGHLSRECPETYFVLEDLSRFANKIDLEVDFFENLRHLQLHRRTRALLKFSQIAGLSKDKPLHCRTLTQFILPLTSQYLCNPVYANKNSIIDAAIETISTICRLLPWHQYELLLRFYLSKLRYKSEFQKQLVRLLVGILDAFHFDLSNGIFEESELKVAANKNIETEKNDTKDSEKKEDEESKEVNQDDEEKLEEDLLTNETENDVQLQGKMVLSQSAATRVISTIQRILLPQLYRTLGEMTQHESSHKINRKMLGSEREEAELIKVPISLALVKLLQRMPKKMLDQHLPGIFMKLCSFLKSPLESVRRTARETLEKIMTSLGPEYLNCLLGEMVTLLSRGYQVHVLSYTMYSVLNSLKNAYKPVHIDACLLTVLEICTKDIFGSVAEEKEVSKIVSKVSEAKSKKSYDTFQLLAQYVTEHCLTDLLAPLQKILSETSSLKVVNKVEECLRFVVLGLVDNQFVTTEPLMIFAYGLASQAILNNAEEKKHKDAAAKKGIMKGDCYIIPKAPGRVKCAKVNNKANTHILMEFGIKLCYFLLKREKVKEGKYLDPFIKIFVDCLRSNHVKQCTLTLQCLTWCFKFDLPSLKEEIEEISKLMFGILHKFASNTGENAEIVVATFKTMAVLVRDAKYHTLDGNSLKILVLYIEQDLHSYERQATAFSLLKSILSRKFNIKELHELMKKISQLSIVSELPHIRTQSRQLFQQYLLDYPLGNKVENHMNFFISQLQYEVQSGRESALEMLHGLVRSFPVNVLKKHSAVLTISLGASLVNDESPECRKMSANCLTSLFERIPKADRDAVFEIFLLWFKDKNISHRSLAAQITGILVSVEKEQFENRLETLKPILLQQISRHNEDAPGKFVRVQEDENEDEEKQRLKDHQLFQALKMLMKIANNCPNYFKQSAVFLESLAVCSQSLLSYAHDWVRLAAAQYLGIVLSHLDSKKLADTLAFSYNGSEVDADAGFLLSNPHDGLKSLTLDLCAQLRPDGVKQDLIEQVIKNLVFVAKVLHQLPVQTNKIENEENYQHLDLLWFLKRLKKIVNSEIVENIDSILLRNEIFKLIAAVCTIVDENILRKLLQYFMSPLIREMISTDEANAPLRQLSKEVGGIIKRKIGIDLYSKTLSELEQKINVRRAVRKRNRTQLAVTDPEQFAKKKIKLQEKKKLSKKRKIQMNKGLIPDNRKVKRRRMKESTE